MQVFFTVFTLFTLFTVFVVYVLFTLLVIYAICTFYIIYDTISSTTPSKGALTLMNPKKRTLISCAMLADEVNHILKQTNIDLPVIWVERGLHSTPEKLNRILQHYIDALQNQDEILLTFGLCGNGTAGLVSDHTLLRLPRFDDCINQLLCKKPRTERKQTKTDAIYLTRSWTLDKEAILQQYNILSRQYEPEMRDMILRTMYNGYHALSVIDTGCYDLKSVEQYADKAAGYLGFDRKTVPGNISTLEHLICGTKDSNILTLAPGEPITASLFEL